MQYSCVIFKNRLFTLLLISLFLFSGGRAFPENYHTTKIFSASKLAPLSGYAKNKIFQPAIPVSKTRDFITSQLPAEVLLFCLAITTEQLWLVPFAAGILIVSGALWLWQQKRLKERRKKEEEAAQKLFHRKRVKLIALSELIQKITEKFNKDPMALFAKMDFLTRLATHCSAYQFKEEGRTSLWNLFDRVVETYLKQGGNPAFIETAVKALPIEPLDFRKDEERSLDEEHERNEQEFLATLTAEGVQETAPTLVDLLYETHLPILIKIFAKFGLLPLLVATLQEKNLPTPAELSHLSSAAQLVGISL